jgi:hypothetical protein
MRWFSAPSLLIALSLGLLLTGPSSAGTPVADSKQPTLEAAVDWKKDTISPVTNAIYFEDAVIHSEIHPVFGYQNIADDLTGVGGDLQFYGIQLRYAVTDRFAVLATKGGYMYVDPDIGEELEGWGDLGVGFKYALIDDQENQFILTPGVTFEFASGTEEIFQGFGDGVFNLFTSAEKGFGKFHVLANAGLLLPIDDDAKSTIFHYHLQFDYHVCKWFIPFVVANGYTVVKEGNAIPFTSEGYDLVNFGSSGAEGVTQVTVGGGFRSRITNNLDFGVAYEKAVTDPAGLLDDRITVDFVIRF